LSPAEFSLDYQKVLQLFIYIFALSFFIELILLVVLQHRWVLRRDLFRGNKEIVAFLISVFICHKLSFDAFAVLNNSAVTTWGLFFTALMLAGGTKGCTKLLEDVMKIKNSPEEIQKIMQGK